MASVDEAISKGEAARRKLAAAKRRRKIDNLARGGLLGALLFALPLFHFPYSQDQFILPKIALGGSILWLAFAWFGAGVAMGRKFRLFVPPVARAVVFVWLAHGVGCLAALREGSSFGLAAERFAWVSLALLFFALLQDFARGRRKYILALGWLIVLSAFLTAAWVVFEDFDRAWGGERASRVVSRLEDWRGKLGAGLGNTGHIADWVALSFPIAVMLLLRVRRKLLAAALMLHLTLGAMALMSCWSVHSNAGLILGSLFLLGWLRWNRPKLLRRNAKRIALQLALWVAAAAFYLVPHSLNPHPAGIWTEAFGSQRWHEGGGTRLVIWGGALSMIRERPILGWGTGNFTYGYPQALNTLVSQESPMAGYVGGWTNAAHNLLLEVFAELGILGLVAFATLLWTWFGTMRRALPRGNPFNTDVRLAATTIAIIGLVHSMMNFPLQLPSFFLFYAALAALPLLLVDRNRDLKEEPMEIEFEQRWAAFSIRGEGMMALRGLGFRLILPPLARRALVGVVLALAGWGIWGNVRWLASNVWYNRGYFIVQRQRGVPAQAALLAFDRALALRPGFPDALSDRAKLRYLMRDWKNVIADTDAALPRLQARKLWLWRGEAFLRLGKRAEAFECFLTAQTRAFPWLAAGDGGLAMAGEELARVEAAPPGALYFAF